MVTNKNSQKTRLFATLFVGQKKKENLISKRKTEAKEKAGKKAGGPKTKHFPKILQRPVNTRLPSRKNQGSIYAQDNQLYDYFSVALYRVPLPPKASNPISNRITLILPSLFCGLLFGNHPPFRLKHRSP